MEDERNDAQQRQLNQSTADLIELRGAALSQLALIVSAAGFAKYRLPLIRTEFLVPLCLQKGRIQRKTAVFQAFIVD